MKKFLAALLLVSAAAGSMTASGQGSSSAVDILVTLSGDGSASVREVWDISISRGTEWYLVRDNLGDIEVSGLAVRDESGRDYIVERNWDIDRTLSQKAGRCGIVRKSSGVEICWGLGSYGTHRYTVEYRMSNVVKSLNDYDALHMQFVSPGISPLPSDVRVRVVAEAGSLDESNTGIWAFGFNGEDAFEDGGIVLKTTEPFMDDRYSVILLARFDKGIFSPASTQDIAFQDKLDMAFKGSSYEEYLNSREKDKKALTSFLATLGAFFAVIFGGGAYATRKRNRRMFGVKSLKEIGYERELPFDGDLFETRYVLSRVKTSTGEANLASALILKMIKDGQIQVTNDAKGRALLALSPDADTESMCPSQKEFFDMLVSAAGNDRVLQNGEYRLWSRRNDSRVTAWVNGLNRQGASRLTADGFISGGTFSEQWSDQGKVHARRAVGFRKFLKDFTLIEERKSTEVALWGDYIIYAALFGIADKVASELKEIDPKAFETVVGYDYPTMRGIINISDGISRNIVTSVARHQSAASVQGHGGHASFGGGGGFSGGGFGGGAR